MPKSDKVGYLGEPMSARKVKAFYEDNRLRNRVAVLCGVAIGVLLLWSELAMLYAMVP